MASEFAEVARSLGPQLRLVSCVGPRLRLESGEDAILSGLGASRSDKKVVALSSETVLLLARESDTSDGYAISDEAVSVIGAADVIVYAIKGHDVLARGDRRAKYLSGLVAGLERSLSTKKVVLAIDGLDEMTRRLAEEDLTLLPTVETVIVDALDAEALRSAVGSNEDHGLSAGRSPEAVALSLESAARKRRIGSWQQLARTAQRNTKQATEVTANRACSVAIDTLIADDLDEAVALLGARWQLDAKFCPDYAAHAASLVDDILVKFDKRVESDLLDTEAYARTRADLAVIATAAVDAAFFETQLSLLAQDTAQHLRTGLKGLRVTKAVKPQTQAVLKDADVYFESRAQAAFGHPKHDPTCTRNWRGRKRTVINTLADYIEERLQVAKLQGTHIPDDSPKLKWPFPVAFSFHWLVPAALGRVETQQRGLSPKDKQLFDIRDGAENPRFPIPAAVSKFSRNLVASNTNSPVE